MLCSCVVEENAGDGMVMGGVEFGGAVFGRVVFGRVVFGRVVFGGVMFGGVVFGWVGEGAGRSVIRGEGTGLGSPARKKNEDSSLAFNSLNAYK